MLWQSALNAVHRGLIRWRVSVRRATEVAVASSAVHQALAKWLRCAHPAIIADVSNVDHRELIKWQLYVHHALNTQQI
jgi:hypothetical protein